MLLTPASLVLAQALLAWDRRRVRDAEASGVDATLYAARQDRAAADVALDSGTWDRYTWDILQTLLESTRAGQYVFVPDGFVPGTAGGRPVYPPLTTDQVAAYHQLARELGFIARLHEVAPGQWPDPAAEGLHPSDVIVLRRLEEAPGEGGPLP